MDMEVARGGRGREAARKRARDTGGARGEERAVERERGGLEGAATRTRRATGRMNRGRVVRRRNETPG